MITFKKKSGICFIILLLSLSSTGCQKQNNQITIGPRSEYNRFIKQNNLEQKAEYVLSKGKSNEQH